MRDDWTVEESIHTYAMRVHGIADDYNWETDVVEALIGRSMLEERWSELSPAQQAEVWRLDDELMRHRERVAEMLPFVKDRPRSHWWWYLHEGPQVREEAEKAARAS